LLKHIELLSKTVKTTQITKKLGEMTTFSDDIEKVVCNR